MVWSSVARSVRSSSLTTGHFHQFRCRNRIFAVSDPGDNGRHRIVTGHTVDLGAVTEPETHCAGGDVTITRQHHERHLVVGVVHDLLGHPIVAGVHLGPHPVRLQLRGNLFQIGDVLIGDRDADHLHGRQPGRNAPA